MRKKKGQAAMEFLMTYGWAILVVLAAIGALAYFGILSPDRWLPTKCTMAGGFSCVEHKVGLTSPQIYLRLQNNLGSDILTGAVFNITSSDCTITAITSSVGGNFHAGTGSATFTLTDALQNGDEIPLQIACSETFSLNQRVRARLAVTYVKSQETQTHTATGEISSKAES